MKISLILFFSLLSAPLLAQFPLLGSGSKHFDQFDGKELSVVLTGDAKMDEALRSSFSKHWHLTKVDFISSNELANSITDENKYFFVGITVNSSTEGQTISVSRTNMYLIITRGGYKNLDKVDRRKWLFAIPMDFWNEESDIPSMAYRIEPCIKLMNDAMTIIKKEKVRISNGPAGSKFMADEFSRNISRLQNKTLLINKSIVRPSEGKYVDLSQIHRASATEEEIKEVYPYKIKVVEKSEFGSAIAENRKGSAVLLTVAFVNQIVLIFDTETLEPLYYTFNKSGLSLKKKDYKKFPL